MSSRAWSAITWGMAIIPVIIVYAVLKVMRRRILDE